MATQFELDCALMAGASYFSTRADKNRFPIPNGWFEVPISHGNDSATGFEASTFTNGMEIVISFAGTYDQSAADLTADANLISGVISDQLIQAAEYYLQVKAGAPAGTTITLTGHSLGGGLAALLGVFFNETAMTFDQAPFRNSASWVVATALKSALSNKFPAFFLDPLDKFIWSFDPLGLGLSPDGLAARETKVSNISVQGEVASTSNSFRIGTELSPLTHGDYAHPVDLHSQSLLTAFLQSQQTAASGKALNDVTFKLTDLLGMIFDKRLFANDTDPASDKVNLLEHLVRHEAGVAADLVTGAAAITADAMVTRFTSDLWKLAQDGGLTVSESTTYSNWNNVSKTLIAFAMQKYYDEKSSSIGVGEALFKDVSGGIQFDTAAVVGEGNSITSAKGFTQSFQTYLDTTGLLSPEERTLIQSILPQLRDWYVQAGTAGMNASDTLNRGAFLLGGNGADALVGGTAADLLVGNAGDDLLQGGQGNDTLLGGSGNDAYVYATGDGLDTILDTSGQNTLAEDGIVLSGGDQYGDARVHRSADGKHLYVDAGQGNLIIDGNIVIQNYASGGSFGLNMTGAVADVNPTTTLDIVGDRAPLITGVQIGYDSLSNIITDPNTPEANRADYLNGSTASDHITSGGGDDQIYATQGGNDLIETGSGRDWVGAGSGNDVIIGGAEGDILNGGDGNDRIYADSQIDVATAIAQGNTQTGTGLQGDWLAGGAGDDTLVGSTGNDVLSGGAGSDLLSGGAGNDDIMGDTSWVAMSFSWSVTDQTDGKRYFYPVNNNAQPTVGGADVIYAGEGILNGGAGADTFVLKLGAGQDVIEGSDYQDGIVFGAGISRSSIVATGSADGLRLSYGNAGDSVLIRGISYPNALHFADGSTLATSDLFTVQSGGSGYAVTGTAADESLVDTHCWANSFTGGKGNDTLWWREAANDVRHQDEKWAAL